MTKTKGVWYIDLTAILDSNYYLQSRTSLAIFIKISFSHFRATLRGKQSGSIEHQVIYPPNGVIPFHGFAMFCAPFCYVYDDTVQLYLCKLKKYYLYRNAI